MCQLEWIIVLGHPLFITVEDSSLDPNAIGEGVKHL